jgi:predicted O-methyltransferase YrrM
MRSNQFRATFNYINNLFAREGEVQKIIHNQIIESGEKQIQVEPFEAKFLYFLIKVTGSKNILEFGTMRGYSTSWLAEAVGDDGKVISIERDPERAKIAQKNLKQYSCVKIINKDAKEAELMIKENGPYDLVFIDANKSSYIDYFNISDKYLKKGGLIIADNCMLDDLLVPVDQEKTRLARIIDKFNNFVASRSDYVSVILPTAGGFLCAMKNS